MKLMKAATETVRQEKFQGRDFTVVPVIAIIEGVLQAANSSQPELVKASEFDPASWNGRPVTFGHPAVGETLVSASASPEIFEKVAIGTLFNAVIIDDKKLRVEAWIDNEKVEEQGDEAVKAFAKILAGEPVEVSTGYFADSTQKEGKFNGERFEAIQSDIKPDHLAILVGDDIGACSLEDGCGTNRVNSICSHSAYFMQLNKPFKILDEILTFKIKDLSFYDLAKHDPEEDEKRKKAKKNAEHDPKEDEEEDEEEKLKKEAQLRKEGHVSPKPNLSKILSQSQLKDNGEISDMDIRGAISSALESKGESFWALVAVFPNFFIFERDFGKLERREFSIADNGEVTISDEGEAVRPVTEFVPVKANEENKMSKVEEMVNDLIANEATQMTEDDRDFLMGLDEAKLSILTPVEIKGDEGKKGDDAEAQAKADLDAKNKDEGGSDNAMTTEKYISEAPSEIKEVLNQGIRMHKERRDELTKAIISNSQFDEEDCRNFSMDHLEKLANVSAPEDHSLKNTPISNLDKSRDDAYAPPPLQAWPLNKKTA